MNQDVIDPLEAELNAAPAATFEISDTVARGRRAVRRRRLAAGAAGIATALVVGGATLTMTDDTLATDETAYAGQPNQPNQPANNPTSPSDPGSPIAALTFDGRVDLASGWKIVRQVDDPWNGKTTFADPGKIVDSVGLVLENDAETRWAIAYRGAEGSVGSIEEPGNSFDTFDTWLAFQTDLAMTDTTDRLFSVKADGTLVPRPEVRVMAAGDVDDLRRYAGSLTAAQLVVGEVTYWVTFRREGTTITKLRLNDDYASNATNPNFAGFVDYLKTSRANGGGDL